MTICDVKRSLLKKNMNVWKQSEMKNNLFNINWSISFDTLKTDTDTIVGTSCKIHIKI